MLPSADEDNDDVIESFWLYIFSAFPSFVYYYLHLYNVMLDYTSLHIIYDNSKLYHLSLLYMITTSCLYMQLYARYYVIYTCIIFSLSKYGIITLTVETF